MSDSVSSLSSLYTSGTYNTTTSTSASSLESTLSSTDLSTADDDELLSVCNDFEEYFVEQIVKSMVKMTQVDGDSDSDNDYASLFGMSTGDDDSSDSGMSTLSSYYGDQMVTMLSEAICDSNNGEGLGIAQTLYEQMKRNYSTSTSTTETTDASSDQTTTSNATTA